MTNDLKKCINPHCKRINGCQNNDDLRNCDLNLQEAKIVTFQSKLNEDRT
jgi:hypothetical protein